MNANQNYKELKQLVSSEGMALFGVANIKDIRAAFLLPEEITVRFDFGISIGYRLSSAVLETITNVPNQIYYFHYQRVNLLLDQTILKITAYIQDKGFMALPVPASQVIDWEKQLGSVSHREIARLAGLGWYGRNNLLVNPKFGSQVRYATVLTDLPLNTDKPIAENCGSCKACVRVCPAAAITNDQFNGKLCHEKLKEFTKTQRIGQMICGVCVKCCPGKIV